MDDGISGTHAENRPALQRMLAMCREGRISTVVVKDLSRLSRDGLYCVGLVEDELRRFAARLPTPAPRRRTRLVSYCGASSGCSARWLSWAPSTTLLIACTPSSRVRLTAALSVATGHTARSRPRSTRS